MSLVFFLVRRALTKAFGGTNPMQQGHQGGHQPHTNPHQPRQTANSSDIVETIWAGMSSTQLRTSFGAPPKTEPIATGEIWTYPNLNGHGIDTEITIENGQVTKWQDIMDTLPPE